MSWLRMHKRLRALADTALPSLRVIGMAYTGLIGVVAVVLVVSVAFLPVPPALQQATQPALVAVSTIVQPATAAVTSLIGDRGVPLFQFVPAPGIALASELRSGGATAAVPEEAAPEIAIDEPAVVEEARAHAGHVPVAAPRATHEADVPNPDAIAEDAPEEEPEQAVEAMDRAPMKPFVEVVAGAPVQQAANVEAPRPLPPIPNPTETAWQTRARLDAENQAAIDAAKAAVVRRKADADTANQAAIDARKAATVNFVATPRPTETAEPARTAPPEVAKPTATPQTRAAANADNQALIDAAKAAKTRAKADANAANQAAIDAAKAHKAGARASAVPTPPPAPSAPPPAPAPTQPTPPTPTTEVVKAPEPISVEVVVEEQPVEQSEAPIMLALDEPESST